MNIESSIFRSDYLEFVENNSGEKGLYVTTHDFKMFLECTLDDAEELAKDLLESIENYKRKTK